MPERKGKPYKDGVLETILSFIPTESNIDILSRLLDRSKGAIEIVFKIAYEDGPFGKNADIQVQKIVEAKNKLGIKIGIN